MHDYTDINPFLKKKNDPWGLFTLVGQNYEYPIEIKIINKHASVIKPRVVRPQC